MYFEILLVIHELYRLCALEEREQNGEKNGMGVLEACRDELIEVRASMHRAEEALCDFEDQDFR